MEAGTPGTFPASGRPSCKAGQSQAPRWRWLRERSVRPQLCTEWRGGPSPRLGHLSPLSSGKVSSLPPPLVASLATARPGVVTGPWKDLPTHPHFPQTPMGPALPRYLHKLRLNWKVHPTLRGGSLAVNMGKGPTQSSPKITGRDWIKAPPSPPTIPNSHEAPVPT